MNGFQASAEVQRDYDLEGLEEACGVCLECSRPLPNTEPDDALICGDCAADEGAFREGTSQ